MLLALKKKKKTAPQHENKWINKCIKPPISRRAVVMIQGQVSARAAFTCQRQKTTLPLAEEFPVPSHFTARQSRQDAEWLPWKVAGNKN